MRLQERSFRWFLPFFMLLACGSDPENPAPPPGPPPLDAAVVDCLRINACDAAVGEPIGLQACLGYPLDAAWSWATVGVDKLYLTSLECKMAAKDCAAVVACTPPRASFTAACAANAGLDLCEGETWVICDALGAPAGVMDCAAFGLTCQKDIWAGCGKEACQFGTTKPICAADDPNVLVECDASGFLKRIDCRTQTNIVHVNGPSGEESFAIAGETCGFDKQRNDIGCIGTGADCPFFSQACQGDVLETCAGGKLGHRDCATLDPKGQSCGFVQSGPFAGAASCGLVAGSCDMGDNEVCEAGVVSFCNLGVRATVDCKAQGFSGCGQSTLGARTVAYCLP